MYAEQAIGSDKYKVRQIQRPFSDANLHQRIFFQGKKDKKASDQKTDHMEKNIKKQARKVEKLQESIEKQIYRHSEL